MVLGSTNPRMRWDGQSKHALVLLRVDIAEEVNCHRVAAEIFWRELTMNEIKDEGEAVRGRESNPHGRYAQRFLRLLLALCSCVIA